tara:strand:+ start:6508 stop:7368 length:861 start_codon:yes stop_codon:yes gene_type:complete
MKVSLFTDYGALNSPPVFKAFAEGCPEDVVYNDMDADVAVIWSILFTGRMKKNKVVWDHFTKLNKPIIVIEVGSIFRDKTWRVGIGGINNLANFANKEHLDIDRINKFKIRVRPYKENNQYSEFITIATQRQDSSQWKDMPSTDKWIKSCVEEIKKYSKKPIVIRPHPRDKVTNYNKLAEELPELYFDLPISTGLSDSVNFKDILKRTWCVVNYSSGPALEAILNGVHIFTGPNSIAHSLSIRDWKDIENPPRIDRTQWLHEFVHTEWWTEEIKEGIPWNRLRPYL